MGRQRIAHVNVEGSTQKLKEIVVGQIAILASIKAAKAMLADIHMPTPPPFRPLPSSKSFPALSTSTAEPFTASQPFTVNFVC